MESKEFIQLTTLSESQLYLLLSQQVRFDQLGSKVRGSIRIRPANPP
jgi:hypothetical protein